MYDAGLHEVRLHLVPFFNRTVPAPASCFRCRHCCHAGWVGIWEGRWEQDSKSVLRGCIPRCIFDASPQNDEVRVTRVSAQSLIWRTLNWRSGFQGLCRWPMGEEVLEGFDGFEIVQVMSGRPVRGFQGVDFLGPHRPLQNRIQKLPKTASRPLSRLPSFPRSPRSGSQSSLGLPRRQ